MDTGNITDNIIDSIQYIDMETDKLPSRARRKVKKNNIVYSTVRPNQRHFGIIKTQPENFLVSTGFAVIDTNDELLNADFLYYLLAQPALVETLHAIAEQSTSAYPSIKPSDIEDLEIVIPSLATQKKIAGILGSLDKKITHNTEVNENLEKQLHALFDAFFIDLKYQDAVPLKHTDFGSIPESWQVMSIGDAQLDISDGNYSSKYPKQDEFLNSGIPFIRGTDFNGVNISQKSMYYISPQKHSELKKGHTKQGDVLITTRGDIGRIAFVPDSLVDANINSQLVRINGASLVPRSYLGCFLTSKRVQDDIRSLVSGSALQQLPIGKLKRVLFLLPDKSTLKGFDALAEPIYQKIFFNNDENYKLSALRDNLLTKLMSGELDVSELDF